MNAPGSDQLVLSHFSLARDHPIEDRVRAAAAAGFDGIGFFAGQYPTLGDGWNVARIRELLDRQSFTPPPVTDEDFAAFYSPALADTATQDRVIVRELFLRVPPDAEPAARAARRADAEALRRQLAEGALFPDLVATHSESASRETGGLLGRFRHVPLVPDLEEAAGLTRLGQISPVVETEDGFFLFQTLHAVPDPGTRLKPLEALRPGVKAWIGREKRRDAVKAYVDGLTRGAAVTPAPIQRTNQ